MKEYSTESVDSEIKKMVTNQKVPNILICGQTGVGKSSAINFLFNDEVALTKKNAEPCTKDITLYKNSTINIYDSEGYEIGPERQAHYQQMLLDDFLLRQEYQTGDSAVHLVWYAISGAGVRITDLDIALIKRIKDAGYPICVLLTKLDLMDADQLEEMTGELQKNLIGLEFFRLSIESKLNKAIEPYCDWDKLIIWSYNHLPDVLKDRFVAGLRGGLDVKHQQAGIAVGVAAASAAAVGASPIPFSQAALLVPIQTGMILRIVSLYGIKLKDGAIASIASGALMTNLGKAAAGGLIQLIPGVGTVIGAIINAGVATALTSALGIALSELCYKYCKDLLDGKPVTFDLEAILSSSAFLSEVTKVYKAQKKAAE